MKEKDKKTEYITLRCTKTEKELLERKSKNQGKAISEYILDCAIAGTERRRCKDRNHIVRKIENQEIINGIHKRLFESKDFGNVGQMICKEIEGVNLWDC